MPEVFEAVDVQLSFRIPLGLQEEMQQHKPKLKKTQRYLFFLNLGLKLFNHKTQFERNPELIQKIVNEQTELLYKTKFGPELEEFFKEMDDHKLDSIKMMISFEEDRRKKEEEKIRRDTIW